MAEEFNEARSQSADRAKTTMSVPEMGKLLGLKKTESYWLLHKNHFEVIKVNGKLRIDIYSFEKWYRNQRTYHKVDGTLPGTDLEQKSYSAEEIGIMLGLSTAYVYELMSANSIEYEIVEFRRRFKKAAFEKWYRSQNRYQKQEDREKDFHMTEATMSMPEMARLLGVPRRTVYYILRQKNNADVFEFVTVAERKRLTKASFERWYASQSRYRIKEITDAETEIIEDPQAEAEEAEEIEDEESETSVYNMDLNKVMEASVRPANVSRNPEYYTADEAAALLGCDRKKLHRLIRKQLFPAVSVMGRYRIRRQEFDAWRKKREEEW